LARDTQIENIAEASPGNDLISLGGRGNRTAAKSESLVKPPHDVAGLI